MRPNLAGPTESPELRGSRRQPPFEAGKLRRPQPDRHCSRSRRTAAALADHRHFIANGSLPLKRAASGPLEIIVGRGGVLVSAPSPWACPDLTDTNSGVLTTLESSRRAI